MRLLVLTMRRLMISVAEWGHSIAGSPTSVVDAIGFIVVEPDVGARVISVCIPAARYGTTG